MTEKYPKYLQYNQIYPCPVCRHGEIANLALMEAFACNFCRHIFTPNLEQQVIKLADTQNPLSWYWQGKNWQNIVPKELEIGWGFWLASIAFVFMPSFLVGLAAYLFPTLPHTPLSWFPVFWTILTFFSHLGCLVWLALEYYQFPIGLYLRNWWQIDRGNLV